MNQLNIELDRKFTRSLTALPAPNLNVDKFQTNITLIYSHGLYTIVARYTKFFSPTCSVPLHAQLFYAVNGKYQKSKEIATNSNYLKCHALLSAFQFPLETNSISFIKCFGNPEY